MKIFIPSKGRGKTLKTHLHFNSCKENVFIVVEPQDYALYESQLGSAWNIIRLPENNKGISFVRNFILELEVNREDPYWMLDDDISKFGDYSSGERSEPPPLEILKKAETIFRKSIYPIAQGALEYDQFAWSQKKPLSLAGYCDVAVWMNPRLIRHARYRDDLNGKEDRAFTLSLLMKGLMTAKASQLSFRCPSIGSNAGGLNDFYAAKKDHEVACRFAEAYPNHVEVITKPNGRVDAKINWSSFKPKKTKSLI